MIKDKLHIPLALFYQKSFLGLKEYVGDKNVKAHDKLEAKLDSTAHRNPNPVRTPAHNGLNVQRIGRRDKDKK